MWSILVAFTVPTVYPLYITFRNNIIHDLPAFNPIVEIDAYTVADVIVLVTNNTFKGLFI
jgi:hypothetical protein